MHRNKGLNFGQGYTEKDIAKYFIGGGLDKERLKWDDYKHRNKSQKAVLLKKMSQPYFSN